MSGTLRRAKQALQQRVRRALLPWRSTLNVRREAGLGDVLMCMPTLREIKRRYPRMRIRFHTGLPALFKGLPYIDEVLPVTPEAAGAQFMGYENMTIGERHLASLIGESVGVDVSEPRPDCNVSAELAEGFREAWKPLPRPHILIQRQASAWTPNKDWPEEYWNELITALLSKGASVIECGTAIARGKPAAHPHYLNLRGKTDLEEVVAAIAVADLFVGPDSGPYHVAAAVGTPAVNIIGGYILPENTAYAGNITLSTKPACSPCWLRTPCPYDLKCLRQITPAAVQEAAWKLWSARQTPSA